jgi:hypothetical protein
LCVAAGQAFQASVTTSTTSPAVFLASFRKRLRSFRVALTARRAFFLVALAALRAISAAPFLALAMALRTFVVERFMRPQPTAKA